MRINKYDYTSSELIPCACECGLTRPKTDKMGRQMRFINGHQRRKNIPVNDRGYVMLLLPNHRLTHNNNYGYEHRLIWEQTNNACLLPWSHVHHKNGIRNDNRPENLVAMMNSDHTRIHLCKDISNRSCLLCGSKKTYKDPKGIARWERYDDGFICRSCYNFLKRRD